MRVQKPKIFALKSKTLDGGGTENYFIYVHSMVNELFMYSSHLTAALFSPLYKCCKIDVRFHQASSIFPKTPLSTENSHVEEENCSRKEIERF